MNRRPKSNQYYTGEGRNKEGQLLRLVHLLRYDNRDDNTNNDENNKADDETNPTFLARGSGGIDGLFGVAETIEE